MRLKESNNLPLSKYFWYARVKRCTVKRNNHPSTMAGLRCFLGGKSESDMSINKNCMEVEVLRAQPAVEGHNRLQ